MTSPSVNLLGTNHDQSARRKSWILVGVFSILVTLISAAGAAASYRSVQSGNNVIDEFAHLPVVGDIRTLVFGADSPLAVAPGGKRDDNKMNILLLGIGGAGHDGPLLTDSIIFASIDLKEKRVGLVSIPRDTAWKLPDGTYEKINAVHAWEEQDHPGEGAILTAKKFAEAFDTHIDHVVRIDFRGFVAFMNALGGIDINVERGFTDVEYPAENDLFQTVSFKKGQQHMDGATALIYVRSRHGNNSEGGDFARAHRQQLVLQAVRERLMSLNTLGDPNKLGNIYSAITSHVQTDLSPWDAFRLAPMIQDFSREKVASHVITDGPDGELVSANVNNNYLLFPKGGDWTRIKSLIADPFLTDEQLNEKAPALAKVEVKNGTTRTGLAYEAVNQLMLQGFDSVVAGNAIKRGYKKSLVFDLTGGKKSVQLAKLRNTLDADIGLTDATSTKMSDGKTYRAVYAEQLSKEIILNDQTDFLVILGENAYSLASQTYATQTKP